MPHTIAPVEPMVEGSTFTVKDSAVAENLHSDARRGRQGDRICYPEPEFKPRIFQGCRVAKGRNYRIAELEDSTAALKARIVELERSEKRLKKQLQQKREELKDDRSELGGIRLEVVDALERVDEQKKQIANLRKQIDRFRSWWLNEYHFVKVLLDIVPNPKDVEVIANSSHSRYKVYCAEGSS
ncbi:hypothetical protein DFP72DRAFT_1078932 [Ephemerocybe angulata]|uniref:Uncharacterized protein n=1 Tax=Ephemerocybe angulata TaxID=980116 RepID=A0A8H6HEC2_9AGAR|nr:hypothetical protein DFP72DRAFT_1078932 [Tulosesus angulatus]